MKNISTNGQNSQLALNDNIKLTNININPKFKWIKCPNQRQKGTTSTSHSKITLNAKEHQHNEESTTKNRQNIHLASKWQDQIHTLQY